MDLPHWPGREQAEQLRQWTALKLVAKRVAVAPDLDALFLIGSFAQGCADEASDLDLIVANERFEDAFPQV